jgi:metal transporter CNNM
LRSELFCKQCEGIAQYCHDPIIVRDENANLRTLIKKLRGKYEMDSETPIEQDVVIIWGAERKRIITGADILGRLLKGI